VNKESKSVSNLVKGEGGETLLTVIVSMLLLSLVTLGVMQIFYGARVSAGQSAEQVDELILRSYLRANTNCVELMERIARTPTLCAASQYLDVYKHNGSVMTRHDTPGRFDDFEIRAKCDSSTGTPMFETRRVVNAKRQQATEWQDPFGGIDPFPRSDENLVINPGFELGYEGFTSSYVRQTGCGGMPGTPHPTATYTINTDPGDCHAFFEGNVPGGNGNMLVVNLSESAPRDFWCQTIEVNPGVIYRFSARLRTVTVPIYWAPSRHRWTINGSTFTADFNPTAVWETYQATWNSGTNKVATLCGRNISVGWGTGDLAVDDIRFAAVCPSPP